MPVIKGLEWTFDTVVEEFDKWSPTFNNEMYDDLLSYKMLGCDSNVLEIGIGTGQASAPILKTGCKLTAVELGKNLAEYTTHKFKDYLNLTVVNTGFQDFSYEPSSYDLIYSANAFHWIQQDLGYTKVYNMLKLDGVFARCAIHPYFYPGKMFDEIQKAYDKYYDTVYSSTSQDSLLKGYTAEQAEARAKIALKYGFTDIDYKMYYRERTYGADEYASLISIYSDHIALPKENLTLLCNSVKNAIIDNGGEIIIRDVIDIELARKT